MWSKWKRGSPDRRSRCDRRAQTPREAREPLQRNRLRDRGLEAARAGRDARSRRIIEARWLREKDAATLHDLAQEFSVSAERIRQIEAKALAKMKGTMAVA